MAKHETGIQWTHVPGYIGATWNPTTGCTRVSPGCDHCYAFTLHDQRYLAQLRAADSELDEGYSAGGVAGPARIAEARRRGVTLPMAPQYDVPFSQVQVLDYDRLTEPLHRKAPRAYFVDSMSDLFHEAVPDEVIDRVMVIIGDASHHLFMVLTKRPARMRDYFANLTRVRLRDAASAMWSGRRAFMAHPDASVYRFPFRNLWLGTSVEDQARADERIPLLLDTPAAVRFLSMEPLLAAVDLGRWLTLVSSESMAEYVAGPATEERAARLTWALSWVIVGGESGKGARPFDVAWARSLRDQCKAAGVPFFMKQLGAQPFDVETCSACGGLQNDQTTGHLPHGCGRYGCAVQRLRLRHTHGANPDEWPEDLRVRQFPGVAVAS